MIVMLTNKLKSRRAIFNTLKMRKVIKCYLFISYFYIQNNLKAEVESSEEPNSQSVQSCFCCSPGRESNSDVRHLNPKTVEYIVHYRFAHLCPQQKHKKGTEIGMIMPAKTKDKKMSDQKSLLTFIPDRDSVFLSLYFPSCWG